MTGVPKSKDALWATLDRAARALVHGSDTERTWAADCLRSDEAGVRSAAEAVWRKGEGEPEAERGRWPEPLGAEVLMGCARNSIIDPERHGYGRLRPRHWLGPMRWLTPDMIGGPEACADAAVWRTTVVRLIERVTEATESGSRGGVPSAAYAPVPVTAAMEEGQWRFLGSAGSRQEECGACGGAGDRPCGRCHNRGFHRCTQCDGYGRLTDASGRDGGACIRCKAGEATCWRCGGSGRVECSTCSGTGVIVTHDVITVQHSRSERTVTGPSQVPSGLLRGRFSEVWRGTGAPPDWLPAEVREALADELKVTPAGVRRTECRVEACPATKAVFDVGDRGKVAAFVVGDEPTRAVWWQQAVPGDPKARRATRRVPTPPRSFFVGALITTLVLVGALAFWALSRSGSDESAGRAEPSGATSTTVRTTTTPPGAQQTPAAAPERARTEAVRVSREVLDRLSTPGALPLPPLSAAEVAGCGYPDGFNTLGQSLACYAELGILRPLTEEESRACTQLFGGVSGLVSNSDYRECTFRASGYDSTQGPPPTRSTPLPLTDRLLADDPLDPADVCFGPGPRRGTVASMRIEGVRYEENIAQCGNQDQGPYAASGTLRFYVGDLRGSRISAIGGRFVIDEDSDRQRGSTADFVVEHDGAILCEATAEWGRPGVCPGGTNLDIRDDYITIRQTVSPATTEVSLWAGVHHFSVDLTE